LKRLNSPYRPALSERVRATTSRAFRTGLLGRSQAVRQWILIPPFGGSIPPAPASREVGGGDRFDQQPAWRRTQSYSALCLRSRRGNWEPSPWTAARSGAFIDTIGSVFDRCWNDAGYLRCLPLAKVIFSEWEKVSSNRDDEIALRRRKPVARNLSTTQFRVSRAFAMHLRKPARCGRGRVKANMKSNTQTILSTTRGVSDLLSGLFSHAIFLRRAYVAFSHGTLVNVLGLKRIC
jgi:hypothetical protein